MIIEIKDAPKMKNIKLDISFEDGEETEVLIQGIESSQNPKKVETRSLVPDIGLDTDEDFEISTEPVEKPVIEDAEREAKIAEGMQDMEI